MHLFQRLMPGSDSLSLNIRLLFFLYLKKMLSGEKKTDRFRHGLYQHNKSCGSSMLFSKYPENFNSLAVLSTLTLCYFINKFAILRLYVVFENKDVT